MTAALVAGLVAGYGIAVPVGAVATYLVSLTARTSLRTGVCAALGVALADGLYALVATAGGATVAAVLRPKATRAWRVERRADRPLRDAPMRISTGPP
ncbi:hypothetical protein AB0L81_39770, partial [Streptomyces sp. NPDC052127]